ncbi:MAG: class I SAM-dependent methyltransferase [Bacteroidetes bacterium]|nr:class I SAM-dependent methyltransferase [Bacteroidota bacterium]
MPTDPTKRFSNRVDNYVKYRPGYPPEVIGYLEKECHLQAGSVIADVGAGTGIFTKLLLERNFTVYAVEPNDAMRHEADRQLKHFPSYHSKNGTAEATGLKHGSVDLVVCAQAFHWFNMPATKAEFQRILKPGGHVALIWNNRDIEADAFAIAYELLLKSLSGGDYERVNHQNLTETDFMRFFADGQYTLTKFHNQQVFDFEQLAGRAFSSSYVPAEETDAGKTFKAHLSELFDTYQKHGKVVFKYNTEVYLGEV